MPALVMNVTIPWASQGHFPTSSAGSLKSRTSLQRVDGRVCGPREFVGVFFYFVGEDRYVAVQAKPIPSSEGKFDAWIRHFVKQVQEHPSEYRIGEGRTKQVNELLAQWETDYSDAVAARDAAKAATSRKDRIRDELTNEARAAARLIQANDRVTNAAREAAGLPVHKTTRTPIAVPTTWPIGFIMSTDRLELTLSYADSATPTRRARPAGVKGCEIYFLVGNEAPQNPAEYRFISLSTRTPERFVLDAADAGKIANYLLRWVNTKGQTGP